MSAGEHSSADDSLGSNHCSNTVVDCESDPNKTHPEYFEYECLTVQEAKEVLNESVETVSKALQITPSLATVILHSYSWKIQDIPKQLLDCSRIFRRFKMKPSETAQNPEYPKTMRHQDCTTCFVSQPTDRLRSLACAHIFCEDCWVVYFEIQISEGNSTNIKCMACEMIAPDDFVLALLNQPSIRDKYQQLLFREYVKSHPQLTNCPGPDCETVIRAKIPAAKQVICNACKTTFCFICGNDYHAPTDCSTIRKWLAKCSEDSETVKYLITHTKCCPNCRVSVERNGGCNHIVCYNCKFEFCWMCMNTWRGHASELFTCSRYMRDPTNTNEVVQFQTKLAVERYLHYYEMWKAHSNDLKVEEERLQRMRSFINEETVEGSETGTDLDFLLDAQMLLLKSINTLKYTYPYAYYMEPGFHKSLYEFMQHQMEVEIESLTLRIAGIYPIIKDYLLDQMDTIEKIRISLLKGFPKA